MNSTKRNLAEKLRRQAYSLSEIANKINVSKSTVSLWCKNILLTKEQLLALKNKQTIAGNTGRIKAAEIKRNQRLEKIQNYKLDGLSNISTLSRRELLIAGIALYWGEGSKSEKLSFINSDPTLIKFMYVWFEKIFSLQKDDFMPRIFINISHKDRTNTVVNFWAKHLNLPISQFGKVTLLKMRQKKIYPNRDKYFGVLALRVRRGTNLLYRMLGLIEGLKNGI